MVEIPVPHALRQYALIADGERGALIGPDGALAWLCFPRWHSPAVFATLVGGGGFYTVSPEERYVWGGYYEPGTLIWRSRWITEHAIIECREALALPATNDRAVVLRHLVVAEGEADIQVLLYPSGNFGDDPLDDLHHERDGSWRASSGGIQIRWWGGHGARPRRDPRHGRGLELHDRFAGGEERDFVLVLDRHAAIDSIPPVDELWSATEANWDCDAPDLSHAIAERDSRHAYAVLSGLTGSTGGMVAAATTSLPERDAPNRSYDYRYVWIRDQCIAGQAVALLGPNRLLDDAFRFVQSRVLADGRELMPAYTVAGDRVPDERSLRFAGYPGGSDVIGNHVNRQFQLDIFGEVLLLFAAAAHHDCLDVDGWRAAEIAIDAIRRRSDDPDAGIWEIDANCWTQSRLQCVAGLRALSNSEHAPRHAAAEWATLADTLLADVTRSCVHPSGRWQRAPNDPRVDASLLLPAIRGAVAVEDPRSIATLEEAQSSLTQDGYVYRYRHDARPLENSEGAFLLCGFWLSLACLSRGEPVEAARWFERGRSACGPPGLYSEEFDVAQRQLRGNLPQAFVHAAMLETALRQSAAIGS
jgi:hypothetical protein